MVLRMSRQHLFLCAVVSLSLVWSELSVYGGNSFSVSLKLKSR